MTDFPITLALTSVAVFVGYLVLCLAVQRKLYAAIDECSALDNRTRFWGYLFLTLTGPGYLVHEMAHATTAMLFGYSAKVRLAVQQTENTIHVGVCNYTYTRYGMRTLLITTAPFFVGLGLFTALLGVDFTAYGNAFLMGAVVKPMLLAMVARATWLSNADLATAKASLPGAMKTGLIAALLVAGGSYAIKRADNFSPNKPAAAVTAKTNASSLK